MNNPILTEYTFRTGIEDEAEIGILNKAKQIFYDFDNY